MFTRFATLCALLGALSTLSLSPTLALSESQQDTAIASLQATVASQQAQINSLKSILMFFTRKTDTTRTDGRKGTELYITGMNLHIVNGLGATDGDTSGGIDSSPQTNGLGNIIIGYNASRGSGNDYRGGSHNLILGDAQNYASYAGIVAGNSNNLYAPYSSILGGQNGTVNAELATLLGGYSNSITIGGVYSSLLGGQSNTVSGFAATVCGGLQNTASGQTSVVSAGKHNLASGLDSTVSGGQFNTATNNYGAISGGLNVLNTTSSGWAAGGQYSGTNPGPGTFHSP